MKHYLSTALFIGAAATLAIAQQIVVVGKDGKSTVFDASEVKEITFEAKPVVETYQYTTLTGSDYGKNFGLIFTEDGLPTVNLDVYTTVAYLEEGTYTVGASTGLYIDTNERYTNVAYDDKIEGIKSGEMTLSLTDTGADIEMAFVLADDTEFKATYKGELPVGQKDLSFTTSQMKQADVNDPKPGEISINFNDAAYKYEGTLDFYLEPGTRTVPAGVYNLSEECEAPSYGPRSQVHFYSPINEIYKITGPVTVTEEGENTKVSFSIESPEGRVFTIDFDGKIDYLAPKVEPVEYTDLNTSAYGKNFTLAFTKEDAPTLSLDIYTTETFIEPGTYKVGGSEGLYIDTDVRYTFVKDGDKTQALKSGEMTVSLDDNDLYTMEMNFILDDDSEFKASFKGAIPESKKDMAFVISNIRQKEANDQKPGEFYLSFNDAAWNLEGTLDFYLAPGTTVIPDGEYNLSDDCTAPCYGPNSQVHFYSPINEIYKITGPVTVSDNGTRIAFDIVTPAGRVLSVTFDGEIEYLPVQPGNVVTLTSAKLVFSMGNYLELSFKADDGEEVHVEVYTAQGSTTLAAGTYTYGVSASQPMTITNGSGLTYVKQGSTKTGFKSGTMEVAETADGYKVDFDLILSGDIPYQATFSGSITK